MIPLFRTTKPERAANLLAKHCRMVLVQSHGEFHSKYSIRFRADMVKGNVYFDRVASQMVRWVAAGGTMISWSRFDPLRKVFPDHEATLIHECPTRLPLLLRALQGTTQVGVVYDRPNWDAIMEALTTRRDFATRKLVRRVAELELLRRYIAALPKFTPQALARILPAQPAPSPPSDARELSVAEAQHLGIAY